MEEKRKQSTHKNVRASAVNKVDKNTNRPKNMLSLVLLGIFWIYTGVFIFIINIGTQGLSSDLTQIYFMVSGVYLILGYLFGKLRKIYLFIGLIFFIFLLGGVLRDMLSEQSFLRWFIIGLICFFGIVTLVLGLRKAKKTNKRKSYIITGLLFISLAVVALFSMRESISFSRLLIILSPLLLVMWGVLNIREALLNKELSDKAASLKDDLSKKKKDSRAPKSSSSSEDSQAHVSASADGEEKQQEKQEEKQEEKQGEKSEADSPPVIGMESKK